MEISSKKLQHALKLLVAVKPWWSKVIGDSHISMSSDLPTSVTENGDIILSAKHAHLPIQEIAGQLDILMQRYMLAIDPFISEPREEDEQQLVTLAASIYSADIARVSTTNMFSTPGGRRQAIKGVADKLDRDTYDLYTLKEPYIEYSENNNFPEKFGLESGLTVEEYYEQLKSKIDEEERDEMREAFEDKNGQKDDGESSPGDDGNEEQSSPEQSEGTDSSAPAEKEADSPDQPGDSGAGEQGLDGQDNDSQQPSGKDKAEDLNSSELDESTPDMGDSSDEYDQNDESDGDIDGDPQEGSGDSQSKGHQQGNGQEANQSQDPQSGTDEDAQDSSDGDFDDNATDSDRDSGNEQSIKELVAEATEEVNEDIQSKPERGKVTAAADGMMGFQLDGGRLEDRSGRWAKRKASSNPASWGKVLKAALSRAMTGAVMSGQSDMSYAKRNPLQKDGPNEPVMMGMIQYPPSVVVMLDSSPTMKKYANTTVTFFSDIVIASTLSSGVTCDIVSADTEITWAGRGIAGLRKKDKAFLFDGKNGGTDLAPVITDIAKKGVRWKSVTISKPDVLIVFTDGKFEWPYKDRSRLPTSAPKIIFACTEPLSYFDRVGYELPKWVQENKNFIYVPPVGGSTFG